MTDGTTPVESVPFTVNLNDVNDVVPVFNPSSYEEDVYEKESEGKFYVEKNGHIFAFPLYVAVFHPTDMKANRSYSYQIYFYLFSIS